MTQLSIHFLSGRLLGWFCFHGASTAILGYCLLLWVAVILLFPAFHYASKKEKQWQTVAGCTKEVSRQ